MGGQGAPSSDHEAEEALVRVRDWPRGHRLFSEGDLHLAFDPPEPGDDNPAILLKIDEHTVTVLRVRVFRDDESALAWFAEQRKHYAH